MLAALVLALAITPIRLAGGPCGNTYAFGSIWTAAGNANAVYRADPRRNRRTATVSVGRAPCGIVSGAGSLWVEDFGGAAIERVSPTKLKVVARIPAGNHVWDVLFAAGSVWATNPDDGT